MQIIDFIGIKFKTIPTWRKITLIVFLVGVIATLCADYTYPSSIWEYSLAFLDDNIVICYVFLFAQLIIIADNYSATKSNFDDYMILYCYGKKRWTIYNIVVIALESCCIIILFILLICAAYLFQFGSINMDSNVWIQMHSIGVLPRSAFFLSAFFIWLRLVFFGLLTFQLNLLTKNTIGFLGPSFITIYDRYFYESFDIMQPLKITFLEHTRVAYTEAVAPATDNIVRDGYLESTVVWVILIAITIVTLSITISRKNFFISNQKER